MTYSGFLRIGKYGIVTFLLSTRFFFSHLSLLLVAFIPALLRAYQMLKPETTIWLEIIVELTRVIMILLMICLLSKTNVTDLRRMPFWNGLWKLFLLHMKNNWPYGIVAQIIVFLALVYGMGNLLISIVSGSFVPTLVTFGLDPYGHIAVHNACLFFLKNMTVIPLTMVYFLLMCGINPVSK